MLLAAWVPASRRTKGVMTLRKEFAMTRLLSKKQVREKVLYSPAHIDRLEKAGQFPSRVQLGPGRVGWVEEEVENWLQQHIAKRQRPLGLAP